MSLVQLYGASLCPQVDGIDLKDFRSSMLSTSRCRKRVVVTSRDRDLHPSVEGFCVNASNPCRDSSSGVKGPGKEYRGVGCLIDALHDLKEFCPTIDAVHLKVERARFSG